MDTGRLTSFSKTKSLCFLRSLARLGLDSLQAASKTPHRLRELSANDDPSFPYSSDGIFASPRSSPPLSSLPFAPPDSSSSTSHSPRPPPLCYLKRKALSLQHSTPSLVRPNLTRPSSLLRWKSSALFWRRAPGTQSGRGRLPERQSFREQCRVLLAPRMVKCRRWAGALHERGRTANLRSTRDRSSCLRSRPSSR
jgi:hypothetical protein